MSGANQGALFTPTLAGDERPAVLAEVARLARDAGMERADRNASETYKFEADAALQAFLQSHETFHVDPFGEATDWKFATKAFGPVVQRAVRAGWMEPTDEYRPSVSSHLAPKRVFRSLVFAGSR